MDKCPSQIKKERKLPYRLKPEESWETWVKLSDIPDDILNNINKLARVRLSNGKILKSKANRNIPNEGYVPGS